MRSLLVFGLIVLCTASAQAAPQATLLRKAAPRGNAGKAPPQGNEWPAFLGKVPAVHASGYAHPDHQVPVPLGVLAAAAHPAVALSSQALVDGLVADGVTPAVARQAAPHLMLGKPSGSTLHAADDHLVARTDVVISYNSTRKSPNWVSWTTSKDQLGPKALRSDDKWRVDPSLPNGFGYTTFHDYELSGYDPGHMVPAADRTTSQRANERTFVTSNTLPQSFNNNRGPWFRLEKHVRDQVLAGDLQAHVIAGGVYGKAPLTIGAGVPVPSATWKVVVFLKRGQTLADVDAKTRVVSVLIPNNDVQVSQSDPFTKYLTTPAEIEKQTGLRFFTSLPKPLADALRATQDAPIVPAP